MKFDRRRRRADFHAPENPLKLPKIAIPVSVWHGLKMTQSRNETSLTGKLSKNPIETIAFLRASGA
jgi:hypothetical protein